MKLKWKVCFSIHLSINVKIGKQILEIIEILEILLILEMPQIVSQQP